MPEQIRLKVSTVRWRVSSGLKARMCMKICHSVLGIYAVTVNSCRRLIDFCHFRTVNLKGCPKRRAKGWRVEVGSAERPRIDTRVQVASSFKIREKRGLSTNLCSKKKKGFWGWHNLWTNRGTINTVIYLFVCLFIDRLVVWMPIRQLSTKNLLVASLGSNPQPLERQLPPHRCQNQSSTSTEFWVMLR